MKLENIKLNVDYFKTPEKNDDEIEEYKDKSWKRNMMRDMAGKGWEDASESLF